MEPLTTSQRRVLEAIQGSAERGYVPTVRELCHAVGVRSTCTVQKHLCALEKKGYLSRRPGRSRSIQLTQGPHAAGGAQQVVMLPLVGRVAAGVPLQAEENVEDYVPLTRALVGQEQAFLLRVRGNSMIGDGILDGDILVVRQQDSAEPGQIVVAMVEGEATVKRFYRENGRFRLQPSHPEMEPIISDRVQIVGRVLMCIRRF